MPGNHTSSGASNMTFVGNMTGGRSMMMPGGKMTFGTSLQNAKMHLTEAIMDLKSGNTRGALMELNLTDQGIRSCHLHSITRFSKTFRHLISIIPGIHYIRIFQSLL